MPTGIFSDADTGRVSPHSLLRMIRELGSAGSAVIGTVLFCKDDTSLPPGAYLGMAQSELGQFDLVEIDGGHETVFTNPAGETGRP